jgi:hypothetical protein
MASRQRHASKLAAERGAGMDPEHMSCNDYPDNRPFNREGALKEYDYRIQGIIATESGILQFIGIIIAAIAGITAAGMAAKNSYIFLFPFALLIIANLYITEKRWVIWLNAAYIRKYLENDRTGIWWETRLSELRRNTKSPVRGIKRVELSMFILIGAFEIVLFAIFDENLITYLKWFPELSHSFLLLRYLLPFGFFLILIIVAGKNSFALKTRRIEEHLLAAFPGRSKERP